MRSDVGMFDVSHMGQVETRGPQAPEFLQRMLSNDVRRLPEGGAQYSVLCREDGGVLDDLFTYRLADCEFLTVTNAANHEKDLKWLQAHAGELSTSTCSTATRASRCSRSRARARGGSSRASPTASCRRGCTARRRASPARRCSSAGPATPARTGSSCCSTRRTRRRVWDALVEGGASPAGLGARDTLRLEVCFHLYGNDLSEDRGPIEAGLGWCCKEHTGFIGSEAIAAARAPQGPRGEARRRS